MPLGALPKLLHDSAGTYREGEEFFMLGKGFFERCSIIDNDVPISKVGLGKMSTIGPTVDHDLITVPMELDVRFVNQYFLRHTSPRKDEHMELSTGEEQYICQTKKLEQQLNLSGGMSEKGCYLTEGVCYLTRVTM